jgi:hypothetical protein
MLKTVSSVTNAIGALNYKGTWNATTNTPTITSSVGVKGDYYQVSVAGSTTINGISNWGVGDVIAFNGTTWQRIEGGADLNGVNLSVSGTTTLSGLTASTALALNAGKDVVSVTNTGTGNNVLADGPTLTTPTLGAATATSVNKVAITAPATSATLTLANGSTLATSGGNSLTLTTTGTTNVTLPTSGTLATTAGTVASFSAGTTGLTPNTATTGAVTLGGTLAVANGGTGVTTSTGSGSVVLSTSPTLTTPNLGVATATSINKVAFTAPATSATLTIANGKTLTANNSIALTGTDATTMTFPSTSATIARTDAGQTFTGVQVMTSPRILTSINDTNGNELVGVTATASAVNEITVANAATTNSPTISATGSDTNIGIRLAPKGTGDVTVVTGNLVIGTSGNGIDFSATGQATGMTSELLSDYEEGIWTPALLFDSNMSGSFTYTTQVGTYTKIGRLVTASFNLEWTATPSDGQIMVLNLPFTAVNAKNVRGFISDQGGITNTGTYAITGGDGLVISNYVPTQCSISTVKSGAGFADPLQQTALTSASGQLFGEIIFEVS